MITLATLEQATAREIFDQVKNHLLTQNKQCLDELSECLYRNDEGLKCAAGCLIADDEYNYNFEFYNWNNLVQQKKVSEKHNKLICSLQFIHDVFQPHKWNEQLNNLEQNLLDYE